MKPKKAKRGRKPIPDKKMAVPLYVLQSHIDILGGKENVQYIAHTEIDYRVRQKQNPVIFKKSQNNMKEHPIDSQEKRILAFLELGNSITPLLALREFGCLRLSGRCFDLKKKGYKILTTMVEDKKTKKRFASYKLVK